MNGAQLAQAIAELARAKPECDAGLATVLKKWLTDTFFKAPDLATLSKIAQGAGGGVLISYVQTLKQPDAAKLAKKLDPLVARNIQTNAAMVTAHLCDLLLGKRGLSERPVRTVPEVATPLPFDEILKLHDSEMRRREFDKMKPPALKKAIKDTELDYLMLPAKASKLEMVEHIEATLAAGWPQPRGILHPSQS
jgi:hypothetical protein